MTKTILMAAAAVFVLSGAAQAADWREGLYIKGGAGWNYAEDQSYTAGGAPVDVEMQDGYAVSGAVGMDYGNMRSELELSHRSNDLDAVTVSGTPVAGVGGDVNATALMLNGYYDIPLGTGLPLTPYVGAGIGAANVNADGYTVGGVSADGDDTVFAYQAMAGAENEVAPKTALYTEYKYFGTDDISIDGADIDYDNHSIMAGVKYSFN